MRKWKTAYAGPIKKMAAPDDPGIWAEISNFVPTGRGSYASADRFSGATAIAAAGETAGTGKYAFAATTPSGSRSYVVGAKIWEVASDGLSITDRTNAVTIGTYPMMAQFGTATICVMGNATATVSSTGGNFAALAGAPKGEIVLTCANAVLIFNGDAGTLYTDGWFASDVMDHTNWTTGEAASGRLLQTPGPIISACVYRDQVYVFKPGSIYRGRYVGGDVKWAWEVVSWHLGVDRPAAYAHGKYACVSCKSGIAFVSHAATSDQLFGQIHFFDGVNPPVLLNPENSLSVVSSAWMFYDPVSDILGVQASATEFAAYCYSFVDQAWGHALYANGGTAIWVHGNAAERATFYGSTGTMLPQFWVTGSNTLTLYESVMADGVASTGYLITSKVGKPNRQTLIKRATPLVRRRVNFSGGAPSVTMTLYRYTERHDSSSTSNTAITEAANYQRFDITSAAPWQALKYAVTDTAVDIEDILIDAQDAGVY
jgi:hypothetical protein